MDLAFDHKSLTNEYILKVPGFIYTYYFILMGASLATQMVKKQAAMQETWVQSLGWEDPLEKGMATHSSSLAWRIPWTEELDTVQSMWW